MQVKIPKEEGPMQASIEDITAQVELLKTEMSTLRKSGIDTTIPRLKSLNLPYKIKVLEQPKDPKYLNNIKKIIEEVKTEIEEIKKNSEAKEE